MNGLSGLQGPYWIQAQILDSVIGLEDPRTLAVKRRAGEISAHRHSTRHIGTPRRGLAPIGLGTLFSNIFENIEGPAHFRIREYSRE